MAEYVRTLSSIPSNLDTNPANRALWRIMKFDADGNKNYLEVDGNGNTKWSIQDNNSAGQQFYFQAFSKVDNGVKSGDGHFAPLRDPSTKEIVYKFYIRLNRNDNYLSAWNYHGSYPSRVTCANTSNNDDENADRNQLWYLSDFYQSGTSKNSAGNYTESTYISRTVNPFSNQSSTCNAMKIKLVTGRSADPTTFIGVAGPGTALNNGSISNITTWDNDNRQFTTRIYNETYLVLDQPPRDMFGLCKGGGVFSADCNKICNGTGDKATDCLDERDKWCTGDGGLDTISDNCVDAMVGRHKSYDDARENACALQLSKESIADVDMTAFLVKYPHCSCFLGNKFYDEFKASAIKKNPDYEDIIKKFDNGRCLFPQCVSSYTKDQPYTFTCPTVQICIETVDVTIGGDIKGDVNIKQATKCTASTVDPTKPPGKETGDDTGDGKDNLPPPPKDPEKTKLTTNMKLIAGFAIGIGFLFLILIVLLLTKKK